MLTAKYIDNDGNETVYEVVRVKTKPNEDGGKQPIEIITVEPNGNLEHYTSGRLFIMNESGSTVSNWIIISQEESGKRIGRRDHPVFGTDFVLKTDIGTIVQKEINRKRKSFS